MSIFHRKNKKNRDVDLKLINADTPFAIRQSYKALYTNILYLNIEDKCKKIAITSALPSEGKTTVSSNLSLTLAQNLEGKNVLLIDTDMRSPKVDRLFGLERNIHGLSEFLAGIDEEPNFQTIPGLNLAILTAGGKTVNPTQLISSQRMSYLISMCSEYFDYIIIDTPPVNIISDALLLNGLVDGYVISTRADHSDINSIYECVESIKNIGAEIFGVVLTDLKLKSSASSYGKYGKYGKYSKYSKYADEFTPAAPVLDVTDQDNNGSETDYKDNNGETLYSDDNESAINIVYNPENAEEEVKREIE